MVDLRISCKHFQILKWVLIAARICYNTQTNFLSFFEILIGLGTIFDQFYMYLYYTLSAQFDLCIFMPS